MNKIQLEKGIMSSEEFERLVKNNIHQVNRVEELGPSDNEFSVSIKKIFNNNFLVTAKMASIGLVFALQATASSPFVALDRAMREALLKVQKWSATRENQDHLNQTI